MLLTIALVCPTSAIVAQRTSAWMDVGGATVQQPGSVSRAAGTVGGGVQQRRARFTLGVDGAVTLADDSVAASQGVARALFAPSARWSTAVDVSATSIGVTWPGRSGNRSVLLRQEFGTNHVRIGGAVGSGRTSRYALESGGAVQQLSVTAMSRLHQFSGSLSAQRGTTDDWQLMEAAGIVLRRPAPSYEIRDLQATLSWNGSRTALSASRTWRAGVGASSGIARGYALSATWTISGAVTFIAQSGRQLADPLRGVPQATYAGAGVRWQMQRAPRRPAADAWLRPIPGAELQLLRPTDGGNGDVSATGTKTTTAVAVIAVVAPSDALVEISTSAQDWTPQRLTRQGDVFVARIPLPSGTHRIAVRVNGGAWRAPRGLAPVLDDFGGMTGVIVVP